MRILYALPYGPSATRVRSRMLLAELATRHQITLLGLAWDQSDRDAFAAHASLVDQLEVVGHGRAQRVRGFVGDPRRPLQGMISTSAGFAAKARALIDAAARTGQPYDVVHVEHLRGAAAIDLTARLPVRTVFDAVDCIAELARLTAGHATSVLVRGIARREFPRTARYEAALLRAADVVTVVAERDCAALCGAVRLPHVTVVPNGACALDFPVTLTPDPVAVFTGKLSYHANQAAAQALLDEIWPRVRLALPDARLVIAGADPPDWLRQRSGAHGVSVVANPPDMREVIAASRVALAPVVYSVGVQNKVLEALACGVPVVASPAALAGIAAAETPGTLRAEHAAEFAALTVNALRDRSLAAGLGAQGHAWVAREHSWSAAARSFEALYQPALGMEMVA